MGSYRIPERQDEINWLFREFLPEPETKAKASTQRVADSGIGASRDAQEITELLCKDPRRRAIFEGGNLDYASDSEADGRLFYNLAFFCESDLERMREVAELSGRRRPKWNEKRRHTDWLGWELEKAAEKQTETINPKGDPRHEAPSKNGTDQGVETPVEEQGSLPRLMTGARPLAHDLVHGVEPPDELEPGVLLKSAITAISAPAGSGKSWMALWLAKRSIERGERVVLLDYENGVRIVTERLSELGVEPEKVDQYLTYFPEPGIIGTSAGKPEWESLLDYLQPDLVLIDGWASSLAESDLDENEAGDIEIYNRAIFTPARIRGCTVVMFDHPGHDHERPRGSSRKKQALDALWSLTTQKAFDRNTVGAMALIRKKDREAWLPETVTFSVGGSESGFVFRKSAGTFEDLGDDGLRPSERKAYENLVRLTVRLPGEHETSGITPSEWKSHCQSHAGMSKASFFRAQKNLIDKGFVIQEGELRRPYKISESHESHSGLTSERDRSTDESHSPRASNGPGRETETLRPASYDLEPGQSSTVGELWEQRQGDIERALEEPEKDHGINCFCEECLPS